MKVKVMTQTFYTTLLPSIKSQQTHREFSYGFKQSSYKQVARFSDTINIQLKKLEHKFISNRKCVLSLELPLVHNFSKYSSIFVRDVLLFTNSKSFNVIEFKKLISIISKTLNFKFNLRFAFLKHHFTPFILESKQHPCDSHFSGEIPPQPHS